MIVFASQHIYGSVHAEESPLKKTGYQTLFYTHAGLTIEEVRILEQYARCSVSQEGHKYQFYLLPSGKAVISHIQTMPELDESAGKHLYFSHALVISSDDYLQLAKSPLGLFDVHNFIHRLEDAYSEGDILTGDISQKKLVSLSAWEDQALKNAQNWNPDDLVRLVRFGWQAKLLRANRKPVAFTGDSDQILDALAVVFLLTDVDKRPLLTFDTCTSGCSFGDGWPFWAWGMHTEEVDTTPFRVDAAAMTTHGSLSANHDTPIERWIAEKSIPSHLEKYIAEQDQTQLLMDMFKGTALRRDILIGLDEEIVRGFTEMNAEAVVKLVLSRIPVGLSQKLLDHIAADVRSAPHDYAIWASAGLNTHDKADYLFHLLLADVTEAIAAPDRRLLENLAVEANHTGLYGLVNLLVGDYNRWDRNLEFISEESYGLIVQAVLTQKHVPPGDILHAPFLGAWAKEIKGPFTAGQFKGVLNQLNKQRGQFDADGLLPLLPYLNPSDHELLVRWVHAYPGPAPQLRTALGIHESTVNGTSSKIKNIFTKGKD
jgi:hypothetical protein